MEFYMEGREDCVTQWFFDTKMYMLNRGFLWFSIKGLEGYNPNKQIWQHTGSGSMLNKPESCELQQFLHQKYRSALGERKQETQILAPSGTAHQTVSGWLSQHIC